MRIYCPPNKRRLRGSNRYQNRYIVREKRRTEGFWKGWIAAYGIFLCCIFLGKAGFNYFARPANAQVISPLAEKEPAKIIMKAVVVTPTPTPTPDGYYYDTVGAIKRIWGKDAYIGIAISSCESGTDPNKYHINSDGSIDFSVFQINTVHGVILDPEQNIRYAYQLFLDQGTTPWNSSKSCWQSKL